MLELAILGLLKEQELHGYELKKRLAETMGSSHGVSFGSLYPALGRLEAVGAVKAVEAHGLGDATPSTGALTGELAAFRARKGGIRGSRGKKVYGITDRGEELFTELLAADAGSSEDERGFTLRLAFARYLPPDKRIGLLERRRAYLLERLAHTRGALRNGWERVDAYTRSLLEHGDETTERDISWLDRLIAREREAQSGPHVGIPSDTAAPAASDTAVPTASDTAVPTASDTAVPPASDTAASAAREWAVSTAPTMPAPRPPTPWRQQQ